MAKKRYHKIANAYDAYWFIYGHPKFQRMHRTEVTPKKAAKLEKQGFIISRDRGGKCWRYFRHGVVPALDENLSIFYTMTDGKKVNKDKSKNKHAECWLEFGPVEYGYLSNCPDPKTNWDMETTEQNFHDWKLDCGGSTFDEALVRLARNIRSIRGDYKPRKRIDKCGPKPCADCTEIGVSMKRIGLVKQDDPKDDRPTCPSCGERINDEMGHMCP